MKLSDAQETVQLASIEREGDAEDGPSVESDEHEYEPVEETACDFLDQ